MKKIGHLPFLSPKTIKLLHHILTKITFIRSLSLFQTSKAQGIKSTARKHYKNELRKNNHSAESLLNKSERFILKIQQNKKRGVNFMKRKTIFLTAILALIAFVYFASKSSAADFAVGSTLENFTLKDINGADQSFDKLKGENGTVIVFLSAQCPVVKGYNDRINEIAAAYQAKGIKFIGINSNATEAVDWVKSNAAEVGYKFPVLKDEGNVLADRLGATVTPEAYFFNEKNVLIYHGAIDNDKYGKNITETYLKSAFDAKLVGKEITKTRANAFGCSIKRAETKTNE